MLTEKEMRLVVEFRRALERQTAYFAGPRPLEANKSTWNDQRKNAPRRRQFFDAVITHLPESLELSSHIHMQTSADTVRIAQIELNTTIKPAFLRYLANDPLWSANLSAMGLGEDTLALENQRVSFKKDAPKPAQMSR